MTKSFTAFLEKAVNLNQGRVDQANAAFDTLTGFVSNADDTKRIVRDTFKQGSLRQGTIIKPRSDDTEFDVDMLVRVSEVDGWEARDYLNAFHDAFDSSDRYKGMRDAKSKQHRCVTINYATNDFHVDVVPSIERDGLCLIMNRESNAFEATDGDGYAAWFEGRDVATSGNLVRVVRLAKYLRDEHGWPVKSILLTTLLGQQVYSSDKAAEFADVPTTLKILFARLDAWLQYQTKVPAVPNPALPSEHFTRHWDQETFDKFRDGLHDTATKIVAAYEEPDGEISGKLWIEAFGDKFYVQDEDVDGAIVLSSAAYALGPTSHAKPLTELAPKGVKLAYDVAIVARVYSRNGRVEFRPTTTGAKVVANRALKFKAITNATGDYQLRWQVVNTGSHAASEGPQGLRGDFFAGKDLSGKLTGTFVNWETTRYTGRHWIQCFLVRDGVCIGMSEKFFVNVTNPQHS
jgi:hypothetical protein